MRLCHALRLQVAFRFKPCALHSSQLKLLCTLNHTSEVPLMLVGAAGEPQLTWDVEDGQLFFRPTCVGASSQRAVTVKNASRVPVGWKMGAQQEAAGGCVSAACGKRTLLCFAAELPDRVHGVLASAVCCFYLLSPACRCQQWWWCTQAGS